MTQRAIDIRRASDDDAPAIAAIIGTIVAEGTPAGLPAAVRSEAEVRAWLQRLGDRGALFLCRADDQPAAFASLERREDEEDAAWVGVWVLPAFRRRGIGTELALAALGFARQAGYRKVWGRIPPGNEPALSFFSAIGALVPLVGGGMAYELPV